MFWKSKRNKSCNYRGIRIIEYRCNDDDLGIKKISTRKQRQRAYHKIFKEQATANMKERLENFSQFQSQLKQ